MLRVFLLISLLICFRSILPAQRLTENIIIITTDGFRWQEVFRGMDSSLASNTKFNQDDSGYIFTNYWASEKNERRKKLLPFFWTEIAMKGQLFGNRDHHNLMDNANPYWFSYPGYSEIMTGFVDTAINRNDYPDNPNVTVLEYLNRQPRLKNKVVAFGAWNAFDRILNEKRSGIPVICAFDKTGGKHPAPREVMINDMLRDSYRPFLEDECLDGFTHHAAMEWLKLRKPRVLYIAYGETDEWAHAGQYRSYLDAAHQVDAWINEIWQFVQSDPQYRNKTTLLITTDHGRGAINPDEWTSHGQKISDAHEIWMAVLGPDSPARGELKTSGQIYQQQIAQTISKLMGYTYKASHTIADEILFVFKMKK